MLLLQKKKIMTPNALTAINVLNCIKVSPSTEKQSLFYSQSLFSYFLTIQVNLFLINLNYH